MSSFPFLTSRRTQGRSAPRDNCGGRGRREFLKTAAATAGMARLGALAGVVPLFGLDSGPSRSLAPRTPATGAVEGLIDTHVHGGDDAFGYAVQDEKLFRACKDKGMAGIVLKDHALPTADRAWFVRRSVPGFKAFGGVVLNSAAGGINPEAVSWMWRMQGGYGRFVWFPTLDADHHVKHFQSAREGIKVLGADGKVVPAVYDVLKICARQRLVVNTGHLAAGECLTVIAAARDVGADRIVVTHAESEVPNLSLEEMKRAADMGAKLELIPPGALDRPKVQPEPPGSSRHIRLSRTLDRIKAIGAENFVLGSDLDQAGKPSPADALQSFAAELMAHGITKDEVILMGREVPGALLMG